MIIHIKRRYGTLSSTVGQMSFSFCSQEFHTLEKRHPAYGGNGLNVALKDGIYKIKATPDARFGVVPAIKEMGARKTISKINYVSKSPDLKKFEISVGENAPDHFTVGGFDTPFTFFREDVLCKIMFKERWKIEDEDYELHIETVPDFLFHKIDFFEYYNAKLAESESATLSDAPLVDPFDNYYNDNAL